MIGQPRIGQTRWGQGRFQPVTLIGTDRRIPSRPAVICTAPTGRTHDCKLPITHRASKKSLQARGRPHMTLKSLFEYLILFSLRTPETERGQIRLGLSSSIRSVHPGSQSIP